MISYDHALIVRKAEVHIDQTASALNHALTAMQSLMALGFEHTHASISDVSSLMQAYVQDRTLKPVSPEPAMDRLFGLTGEMLRISGEYNSEIARLFQAQLSEVDQALAHLRADKALAAAYGGDGAIAAVQEAVDAAKTAMSKYQKILVDKTQGAR